MNACRRILLLAVQIEASFASPLPRSKRNHRHCVRFQVSLDFSMASIPTVRSIAKSLPRSRQVNGNHFGGIRDVARRVSEGVSLASWALHSLAHASGYLK